MTTRKLVHIVLSALVIVALPLLGWGIHDTAGYFASAARAAFLPIMVMAMTAAAITIQKAGNKGTRTPPGQRLLFASLQVITIALVVFLPFGDRRGILVMRTEWVRWFGLSMIAVGNVIILIALRTLGRNYSVYVTIQERHQLVQNGIYGVVRNPIYLGNLISWPGACLVFRSWLLIPAIVFFATFAVLRGAQEERVLSEEFSAEFDAYCQRTWRLVPYVY